MHCLTAWGQWAVQLLQCTAPQPGGSGQSCIASLPRGSGQCNSCHTLPHCLGAVGSGTPAMRGPTSWGDGESCPGGGRCQKSGPPAIHCHTAWGQWAVELLQRTASLPGGSGQWNSCYALPHCLGAVGSATPAMHCPTAWGQWAVMHCLTAWGQWAVQFVPYTASLPGGSGQWNSCYAVPHRLGAVGSGTPAMRGPTSWGDGDSCPRGGWCLQSGPPAMRSTLPRGSAQWNSCHALPHCSRAVSRGQWACALQEFHCPPPPGGVAVHCRSCTDHCPEAVRQCIAGIALPTAPRQRGSVLQESHCPLRPVYCRGSTAHSPQAVRQCIAGVARRTAPGQ